MNLLAFISLLSILICLFIAEVVYHSNKKEALKYSAIRLERRLQEANRIINEGLRVTSTKEDLKEKYQAMEESRKRIFEDCRAKIQAAQTLGLNNEEIKNELIKSTNLSKSMIESWMEGTYTPYQPGTEKRQKIEEKLGIERLIEPRRQRPQRRQRRPKRRRSRSETELTPLEQLIGEE
jgi:hypothetical protein